MKKIFVTFFIFSSVFAAHSLQIGDHKEKFRVDLSDAHKMSEVEKRAIKSTVKILNNETRSLGTGFFYKKIGDEFYFITNNHVLASQRECDKTKVMGIDDNFKTKSFKCDRIIKTAAGDLQSDFTVFTLKDSDYVEKYFSNRDNSISPIDPQIGDELITAGFGSRKFNSRFDITLSNDSDCIVLAGPVTIQLPDYAMDHTLSVGCDISGGDSGSAVFNKNTGELVALLFAAAIPDKSSVFDIIFGKDDNKESNILTSSEIREHLGDSNYYRFWQLGGFASQLNKLDLGIE